MKKLRHIIPKTLNAVVIRHKKKEAGGALTHADMRHYALGGSPYTINPGTKWDSEKKQRRLKRLGEGILQNLHQTVKDKIYNSCDHLVYGTPKVGKKKRKKMLKHQETNLKLNKPPQLGEAIKGWKHAHSDLMNHRQKQSEAAKTIHTHDLKKDGGLSGMATAKKAHNSIEDARKYIEHIKSLNPHLQGRHSHAIFDSGKEVERH